jgi:hypothetical protein
MTSFFLLWCVTAKAVMLSKLSLFFLGALLLKVVCLNLSFAGLAKVRVD